MGTVPFGFPDQERLTSIFEGGAIVEQAGRRWIVPPVLTESLAERERHLDVTGQILAAVGRGVGRGGDRRPRDGRGVAVLHRHRGGSAGHRRAGRRSALEPAVFGVILTHRTSDALTRAFLALRTPDATGASRAAYGAGLTDALRTRALVCATPAVR